MVIAQLLRFAKNPQGTALAKMFGTFLALPGVRSRFSEQICFNLRQVLYILCAFCCVCAVKQMLTLVCQKIGSNRSSEQMFILVLFHFNSFMSFFHVNLFVSIRWFQFIHFMHFISFLLGSFQLIKNSYMPRAFFETSAPAPGHCLGYNILKHVETRFFVQKSTAV